MGIVVKFTPVLGSQVDVSEYVDAASVGNLTEALDFNSVNIGVFRNSSISLKMNNELGTFSQGGKAGSVFTQARDRTLVRILYKEAVNSAKTGFATAGSLQNAYMSPEQTVFLGVIAEKGTKESADQSTVTFQVLSIDSLLDKADAVSSGTPDLFANIVANLNTDPYRNYATATSNTVVNGLDLEFNLATGVGFDQFKDARAAVNELLSISNSFLKLRFFEDTNTATTILTSRRPDTTTIVKRFYGPNSTLGVENIIAVNNENPGFNRVFNSFSFGDGQKSIQDSVSVSRYGLNSKTLSSTFLTDGDTQISVLNNYMQEFSSPRQELDLIVPLSYDNLSLELLDVVTIDYPGRFEESDLEVTRYGFGVYGTSKYARALESRSYSQNQLFKVYEKKINFKNDQITLKLREA